MQIETLHPGQTLFLGDVKVTVLELGLTKLRVGVETPPGVRIRREPPRAQDPVGDTDPHP